MIITQLLITYIYENSAQVSKKISQLQNIFKVYTHISFYMIFQTYIWYNSLNEKSTRLESWNYLTSQTIILSPSYEGNFQLGPTSLPITVTWTCTTAELSALSRAITLKVWSWVVVKGRRVVTTPSSEMAYRPKWSYKYYIYLAIGCDT